MRRRFTLVVLTAAALLLAATAAIAAQALPGKTYSGTGQEFENNGPHFETFKSFRQHMSLTVSADGSRVQTFKGFYFFYCGAGKAFVSGNKLKISPSGRFGGTGSRPTMFNGKRTGTDFFVLRGQFIDAGKKADVTYQATSVSTGAKDPHPYSLSYQPSGGCQNKVVGTVKVK